MSYQRVISRWISFSAKHPYLPLMALIGLTLVAWPILRQLRLDTDFKKLLPRSYERVREMDRAVAKAGDTGYFSVTVETDDIDVGVQFIRDIATQVSSFSEIRTVDFENPVDFLRTNRFLLVPLNDLQRIHRAIKEKKWEKNPFFFDLEDDSDASSSDPDTGAIEEAKEAYRKLAKLSRYHVSPDQRYASMQIRPKLSVTRIADTKKLYDKITEVVDRVKSSRDYPGIKDIWVEGSLFDKIEEYSVIMHDILSTAWVSAVLVIAILLLSFRNPLMVLLLLVPLLCAIVWSFAIAALTVGYLNLISGMLFVVMLGLGIDHGVHLMKRYIEEKQAGRTLDEALRLSFRETGVAILGGGLTTALGFLLMLVTDFKGFSHFGLIAGIAMVLILVAYFLSLPAIVFLFDRNGWMSWPFHRSGEPRFWVFYARWLNGLPVRPVLVAFAALALVGIASLPFLKFNYDFDTVTVKVHGAEGPKSGIVYKESLTPGAVLIAPNDEVLDKLLHEIEMRKTEDRVSPTIGRVISLRNFLPSDQPSRIEEIHAIAAELTPVVMRGIKDPELKELLNSLKSDAHSLRPITEDDLPK